MQYPVYIAGAGPGDPDLLTLKVHRLITQWAEVIVYDRLIDPRVIALFPSHVQAIYAGKAPQNHTMKQDEIHTYLLEHAAAGKKVLRLKGGDPYVYGRGGEEMDFLRKHSIPCEVVSGISSAFGAAAALCIPLTHREVADNIRILTAHEVNTPEWKQHYAPHTTYVIYMGLATLPDIIRSFLAAGMPAHTPVAVVKDATMTTQQHCITDATSITQKVQDAGYTSPVMVILGEVVRYSPYAEEINT